MTTAPELLELFEKRPLHVIKPGLARMEAAKAALSGKIDLGLKTPSVLIGGTNGKGSTSGFLYQLLMASGVRAGLFTSPHLINFSERMCVGFEDPVTDADLVYALRELKKNLPSQLYLELSFFEINTLLAWMVFSQKKTEFNIFEVGLGGRLDATNAGDPELSIITSIGLDHQEYLGHTLAAIAKEKAGIMRSERPVLWGGGTSDDDEAYQSLRSAASKVGAKLLALDEACDEDSIEFANKIAQLRLWPQYLKRNFLLALLAFKKMGRGNSTQAYQRFFENNLAFAPSLVGRFQMEMAAPHGEMPRQILLDVCHNPHGARAFSQGIRQIFGPQALPAIVSIFGDKDCNGVLDELRTVLGDIVLYPQKAARAWRREQLLDRHQDLPWCESLEEAWQFAKRFPKAPLVCCGSVHGIGELLKFLNLLTEF